MEIQHWAFSQNQISGELDIPNCVRYVGAKAFLENPDLNSVVIPPIQFMPVHIFGEIISEMSRLEYEDGSIKFKIRKIQ